MAKKKTSVVSEHVCDDCVIGQWYTVHWNLSVTGQPLTKHCIHGGKCILRGTPACKYWKNK